MINENHANKLALFGIKLKNETKSHSVLQLKNKNEDVKMSSILYQKLLSSVELYNLNSIKLPDITFGVEFEFVGTDDITCLSKFNTKMHRLLKSNYLYAGKYAHNDGYVWVLGKDSSIKYNSLAHETGYELSSAKLHLSNERDISLLKTVISYIEKYLSGIVNDSCGTHVHISFEHKNLYSSGIYRRDIRNLLLSYGFMERVVFDPIVPTSRRRNIYCKPTTQFVSDKYQKLSARYCEFNKESYYCNTFRLESRQLEGTLDTNTVISWVTLQSYIIYDLLSHIKDMNYITTLSKRDILQILFSYDFSSDCINLFLERIINFRSRNLASYYKTHTSFSN